MDTNTNENYKIGPHKKFTNYENVYLTKKRISQIKKLQTQMEIILFNLNAKLGHIRIF